MKVEIHKDAQLVVLHTSLGGVRRRAYTVSQEQLGRSLETERRVETVIADTSQHGAAMQLCHQARALVPKFAAQTPLGWLTDSKRGARLQVAWAELKERVRAHNNLLGQAHPITVDLLQIPIGQALDADSQRILCDTVYEALTDAHRLMLEGDFKSVLTWNSRHKNLHTLMPALVGGIVKAALDCIRDQRNEGAERVRELEKEGSPVDPKVVASLLDLEPVTIALGWVAPPMPTNEA